METQAPGLAGFRASSTCRELVCPSLAPGCHAQALFPGLWGGRTCTPTPHTPPPSAPRGPGSRRPKRRKRRPDPAAAHPGSAPAAPRTAGSAPAAPPGSGPSPAPRGGRTGRGTATTTPRAASSRARSRRAHFRRKPRLRLHSRSLCRHCFRGGGASLLG